MSCKNTESQNSEKDKLIVAVESMLKGQRKKKSFSQGSAWRRRSMCPVWDILYQI